MTSRKKHNKYDCADIEKMAQQYVDGDLNKEETCLFEEHLEYCLPCDKKMDFERKLKNMIRQKLSVSKNDSKISEKLKGILANLK